MSKKESSAPRGSRNTPATSGVWTKMPRRLPAYIGFGDENEAVAYVSESFEGWRQSEGALAWLAEQSWKNAQTSQVFRDL